MDAVMEASGPPPGMSPGVESKEPWLGANLWLCLPGLGQWYAGARASGGLELGAGLVLMIGGGYFTLAPGLNGGVGMILLLGLIPLWAFSAWTAHRACRGRAAPGFDELRRSQRDAWKAVFLTRFLPGLGQLYDRRIGIGAVFVVVVVVPFPSRPDQMFLKRVFALPGDVVEFRSDGAYRKGERIRRGRDRIKDHTNITYGREGTPYRIPEGTIFAIGDNFANSNDSRFFGPIALESVKGRAYKIYWPPARARTL